MSIIYATKPNPTYTELFNKGLYSELIGVPTYLETDPEKDSHIQRERKKGNCEDGLQLCSWHSHVNRINAHNLMGVVGYSYWIHGPKDILCYDTCYEREREYRNNENKYYEYLMNSLKYVDAHSEMMLKLWKLFRYYANKYTSDRREISIIEKSLEGKFTNFNYDKDIAEKEEDIKETIDKMTKLEDDFKKVLNARSTNLELREKLFQTWLDDDFKYNQERNTLNKLKKDLAELESKRNYSSKVVNDPIVANELQNKTAAFMDYCSELPSVKDNGLEYVTDLIKNSINDPKIILIKILYSMFKIVDSYSKFKSCELIVRTLDRETENRIRKLKARLIEWNDYIMEVDYFVPIKLKNLIIEKVEDYEVSKFAERETRVIIPSRTKKVMGKNGVVKIHNVESTIPEDLSSSTVRLSKFNLNNAVKEIIKEECDKWTAISANSTTKMNFANERDDDGNMIIKTSTGGTYKTTVAENKINNEINEYVKHGDIEDRIAGGIHTVSDRDRRNTEGGSSSIKSKPKSRGY